MAIKKQKAVPGAKTKKRTRKNATPAKSGRQPNPHIGASKLQADFDADPLKFKPLQPERAAAVERQEREARSAGQSGSLQGLSDLPGAASESVDELLEEGNAFEAEVIEGVEDAPDADQGEVRTHEVPEDDVPEEYTDHEP